MINIILLNVFIDYTILYTCSSLLRINTKNIRLVFASLFGLFYLITFYIRISNILLLFLKLLNGFIMIIIAFGYDNVKSLIKNVSYFYIINFFLGGILYYFKNENLFKYKFIIFLIPLFLNIYRYFLNDFKKIISLKYKVTVYLNNGKIIYLNGLLDTGNNLIEPFSNRKVIITNKKIKENYYLVPYTTIDRVSLLKCFNPKKVYIDGLGERDDISIGIVNKRFIGFNCLLNNKLMEE